MTVEDFAEQHKLRLRRDDCGEHFVPCRRGQISDHGDGYFALMILDGSPRAWGNVRRTMEAAGFKIVQDGDSEGVGLFDPAARQQAKVAIKVARPYRRKQYRPEVLEKLRQNAKKLNSVGETTVSGALQGQDSIASLG